ncbi:MAG: twin-arginine translocase TatA/TatE family subunit [bacterium]|nr:twin-arginine translocase TatA/TatE family subunit [bacterium]
MAWGPWQILVVAILILVLFGGAKKIPELARSLGKAKGEFKKGTEEGERIARSKDDDDDDDEEEKPSKKKRASKNEDDEG